jgi:hypothetical protein
MVTTRKMAAHVSDAATGWGLVDGTRALLVDLGGAIILRRSEAKSNLPVANH